MTQVILCMLQPESAFGTPLVGDTLFGQVCWAIRERFGEDRLEDLLQGYVEGSPFIVLSDAFPQGHLPRPQVPGRFVLRSGIDSDPTRRKEIKKRVWLPVATLQKDSSRWLDDAVALDWMQTTERSHNSLDRLTGTTGSGDGFAPFAQDVVHYANAGAILDLYAVLDSTRMNSEEFEQILSDIGTFGYGRNATTGEGRFTVLELQNITSKGPIKPLQGEAPGIALANVAPQGLSWIEDRCWYTPVTRFGRHGAQGALSGRPFKNPVLLATTGAILTPAQVPVEPFLGQGIGGGDLLSKAVHGTVHQGYAPVVPLTLRECA